INDYPTDNNIILYYTLDGSNPADSDNQNRIAYNGEQLVLNQATTVKAVYFSACGKCVECKASNIPGCWYGVYGETGTYKYTVPTTVTVSSGGGGGGGTRTVDKTRKYTMDIFGNEHPTHIGYINGYPDGSVKPEGDITREEITSILYRITNHEYEKPFVATGDAFPDVEQYRWSAHDIEYMSDKNIVYGYPDGEFKPSQNLTRAEFAALIFRFTGIEKSERENPFTDLDETHWAYEEIIALTESGLIEGYEDSTFRAENNITRAEVMTVVNKLLGRKPIESYVKSLDFNPYNDLYEDKWYYVTVLEATITHNYWLNDTGYEYKWEDWK
ncbi:MAG: S-layer homology domain-containing protein, partial [Clostridia bacterium]|nr:S-layer homology domain-containing protein [Clostridia bacterium]